MVTACGLQHMHAVSVTRMKCSLPRVLPWLAAGCCVAAGAAEPPLPREAVTLAGREAESVERGELTLAGADEVGRSPNFLALPVRGRSGVQALVAGGEAGGPRWQLGGIVLAQRKSRFDLDGTSVSLPVGPGRLYASVERRHWGPSPFGSLILDGAARALPSLGWRKTSAEAFAWPGLAWLGPWRTDLFAGRLQNDIGPGGVKLLGWRLEIEPLRGLQLGGSRVLQWGGDGRPQTLGSLLRGIAGVDNFEEGLDRSAEPGNQLAGFDARWTLPWGGRHRVALYGQAIGEDEAGHLPSLYLVSGGGEVATTLEGGAVAAAAGRAGRHHGRPRLRQASPRRGLPASAVSGRLRKPQRAAGASGGAGRADRLAGAGRAPGGGPHAADGAPRQQRPARRRCRPAPGVRAVPGGRPRLHAMAGRHRPRARPAAAHRDPAEQPACYSGRA